MSTRLSCNARAVLPCLLLAVAAPAASLDEPPELTGRWRNEQGSEMVLELSGTGALSGRYRSAVGRVSPDNWYPVAGFSSGDQVGFCVHWARPSGRASAAASVSCMVGEHTVVNGVDELRVTWLLERNVPDEREAADLWSAVTTGSSMFRRPPAPAEPDPAGPGGSGAASAESATSALPE